MLSLSPEICGEKKKGPVGSLGFYMSTIGGVASALYARTLTRVSAKQLPLRGQVKVRAIKEYLQAHTFSWLHNDTLQYNYRSGKQCEVYI